MTYIYNPPVTPQQTISDAIAFLSHLQTEAFLLGLIILAVVYYLLRRDKAALIIAFSGALYLIPFLVNAMRM